MWYDVLDKLTADIAGKLEGDQNLSDVPVMTERRGDLDNEVKRRLGALKGADGKFGACIIVQAPVIKITKANASIPLLEAHLSILHVENSAINFKPFGTQKTAAALTLISAHTLWFHRPTPFAQLLVPSDPFIDPVEHTNADVAYALGYHCALNVEGIPPRLPVLTMAVDQVVCPAVFTISHPNSDAQIYWTMDDSYPRPGNPQATLYTEPFTIHEPCHVRAIARLLGSMDSSVVSQTIT